MKCTGTPGRCGAATPQRPSFSHLSLQGVSCPELSLPSAEQRFCGPQCCCHRDLGSWTDKIDNPFVCMDIRNICYPFLIGSICVKVSVEEILILVHLLPHLYPLPWSADFCQDVILFHHSQHCFGVVVDPMLLQPQPHPSIAIGLPASLLL